MPRFTSILVVALSALLITGCVDPAVQRQKTQAAEAAQRRQLDQQFAAQKKADQDRRDAYIATNPQLTDEIKAGIHDGKLVIGMTWMDVKAVLDPTIYMLRRVNRDTNAYGVREQWVLGDGRYLYFDNGVLESIQS